MAKKRILVADDNAMICMSAEDFLQHCGYDCVTVSDGTRAWELLESGEVFDGIISDNDMPPGMSGIELLEKVRDNPRTKEIPFVLMSGRIQTSDGVDLGSICKKFGAMFFSKPNDYKKVLDALMNA